MSIESRFTSAFVVAFWGVTNFVVAALLLGFIVGGFGGFLFEAELSGGAVAIIFTISLLVVLARRRHPRWRGLRSARRPAVALLFAVGFMLMWFGLAFGMWVPMLAGAPFLAAIVLQFYPHRD